MSGTLSSGINGGHAINAEGDVTANGCGINGGDSTGTPSEGLGRSAIVSHGNITLSGAKIYDEDLDETFFSCWVRSGLGNFCPGTPIVMEGTRNEGPKIITATNAMVKNADAGYYASPYNVKM